MIAYRVTAYVFVPGTRRSRRPISCPYDIIVWTPEPDDFDPNRQLTYQQLRAITVAALEIKAKLFKFEDIDASITPTICLDGDFALAQHVHKLFPSDWW